MCLEILAFLHPQNDFAVIYIDIITLISLLITRFLFLELEYISWKSEPLTKSYYFTREKCINEICIDVNRYREKGYLIYEENKLMYNAWKILAMELLELATKKCFTGV